MEGTITHPKQAVRDFIANSVRKQGHIIAFWVDKTDPSKLDWVPGEEGVSKARPILNQVTELVTICRTQAAKLRGESAEGLTPASITNGAEACAQLVAASNEVADALMNLPPEKLDEEVDSFLGKRPLQDVLEIALVWNMSYHGGVVNAYQLMYGDETFHIPPM